ncbi:MAG: hypothetical protein IBX50_04240 [Marinospirillum sp.]|uniref:hypothetical protein n=1 Tax=Marinospirillum sp. TaxID=2183934 RepID=UPI001A0C59EC|nr:hypothetical protein [Marinospirillum sp.]MBE0505916.1 hypothetical protein [Marinospirillum sp.]
MVGDLNMIKAMRQINKRMVNTAYRHPWQFRIEMDQAPKDFDLFVKSISQEPYTLETNPFMAGATPIHYPSAAQPVTLAMTCYDHEDERMYRWMEDRVNMVVNADGTWNLPIDYLITCKVFRRLYDGSEVLRQHMRLVPLVLGEITESVDAKESLEFPMTFVEFRAGSVDY